MGEGAVLVVAAVAIALMAFWIVRMSSNRHLSSHQLILLLNQSWKSYRKIRSVDFESSMSSSAVADYERRLINYANQSATDSAVKRPSFEHESVSRAFIPCRKYLIEILKRVGSSPDDYLHLRDDEQRVAALALSFTQNARIRQWFHEAESVGEHGFKDTLLMVLSEYLSRERRHLAAQQDGAAQK
jgi:hypothetical protein